MDSSINLGVYLHRISRLYHKVNSVCVKVGFATGESSDGLSRWSAKISLCEYAVLEIDVVLHFAEFHLGFTACLQV